MKFQNAVTRAAAIGDQLLGSCVELAMEQMAQGNGPKMFDQFQQAIDEADPFEKALLCLGFGRLMEAIRDCNTE